MGVSFQVIKPALDSYSSRRASHQPHPDISPSTTNSPSILGRRGSHLKLLPCDLEGSGVLNSSTTSTPIKNRTEWRGPPTRPPGCRLQMVQSLQAKHQTPSYNKAYSTIIHTQTTLKNSYVFSPCFPNTSPSQADFCCFPSPFRFHRHGTCSMLPLTSGPAAKMPGCL